MPDTLLIILGVAIGLAPLVVAGLYVLFYFRRIRQDGLAAQARQRQQAEAQRRAVWAGATIVSVEHRGLLSKTSGEARLHLVLKVQPPAGEPFTTSANWLVESGLVAQLQPGQTLSVKLDPDNPQVVYPNLSGARPL